MKLGGKVVVVTGGGNGIGRALCRRFSKEEAKAIVVADMNAATAKQVADEIGGTAVTCDVSREADVVSLVSLTLAQHGGIDLFCSNAGIGTGAGIEGSDAVWRQAFDVHVMAHVYAARAVLPGMLDRGHGYLLNTASAAGLLTSPGDAPYTVTKHGAVALAEWLAVEYRDRGIGVSVLCPFGVATPLLMEPLAQGNAAAQAVAASGEIITPEQVADTVVAGLAAETFLILPHPQVGTFWAQKASDPDRWLAGVRRLLTR